MTNAPETTTLATDATTAATLLALDIFSRTFKGWASSGTALVAITLIIALVVIAVEVVIFLV